MSRASLEAERQFLIETWRRSFDLGGPHHSKEVREWGTVDHIASIVVRALASGEPSRSVGARVLYLIVNAHPFWDCNHRTGTAFLGAVMTRAGYSLRIPDEEAAAFVRRIDADGLSLEEVEAWVRRVFA
jgi:hypothetical protein